MVGSAIVRRLADEPIGELITATSVRGRPDPPGAATEAFVADARPDVAILAAAKVGGIHANRTRRPSSSTTT
jgi:GDP-L-fucose synthase